MVTLFRSWFFLLLFLFIFMYISFSCTNNSRWSAGNLDSLIYFLVQGHLRLWLRWSAILLINISPFWSVLWFCVVEDLDLLPLPPFPFIIQLLVNCCCQNWWLPKTAMVILHPFQATSPGASDLPGIRPISAFCHSGWSPLFLRLFYWTWSEYSSPSFASSQPDAALEWAPALTLHVSDGYFLTSIRGLSRF